MNANAYCAACMQEQPFDRNWRALWIDSEGRLLVSQRELDFERPEVALACGHGSALVLVERFLDHGSFQHATDALGGVDPSFNNEPHAELT